MKPSVFALVDEKRSGDPSPALRAASPLKERGNSDSPPFRGEANSDPLAPLGERVGVRGEFLNSGGKLDVEKS